MIPLNSIKQGSAQRILVMRGGAIGDFILTLPVLAALQNKFPGCRLEILGYPRIASLAVAGGLAAAVQPLESPNLAGFFSHNSLLDPAFCAYFASFDCIVSFVSDPEGIFRSNIARCSSADFTQGPHRPNENDPLHATEVFLSALAPLGIRHADPKPRLKIARSSTVRKGFWLAMHPGSGSEKKNWPEERWKELVSKLMLRTRCLLFLAGGEAEQGRLQRLALILPSGRFEIADQMALPELAANLTECGFFIGHDSGIAHLAAAVGVPGLILWGPTNPVIWRPRADNMELLIPQDGLHSLSVSAVEQLLHLLARGLQDLAFPGG
jgi:ADP-heptose:LPS heptosyltransferase